MEKERYEFREVESELDLNDTEIAIVDNEKGGIISYDNACKLLNQQDTRIKELEEENRRLFNLTQLNNCENCEKVTIKTNQILTEENQQLKQQLSDEECEELRKQIKFESKARERFKQSQNQKAIEELEKIIEYIRTCDIEPRYWDISKFINNQINELRGNNKCIQ